MVDAIDNSRVRSPLGNASSSSRNTTATSNGASSAPAQQTDQVDLQSADLVASLKQQAENVPEVDQARVDAIKQAIANGDYQPNPERIAQQFAKLESLL